MERVEGSDNHKSKTDEELTTSETRATNGHGGGPTDKVLELYNKARIEKDQEILLNLIEHSKDTTEKVKYYVTKKPAVHKKKKQIKKIVALDIQKKRQKRKKFIDKLTERRRPSHMQLYWEKRLERAQKNVLNESLFRDEIKKTTPPPSRKGGGEQYKPTTSPPPGRHSPAQYHSMERHHQPAKYHQSASQYKHRHEDKMLRRQNSRITSTDIILYKQTQNNPEIRKNTINISIKHEQTTFTTLIKAKKHLMIKCTIDGQLIN